MKVNLNTPFKNHKGETTKEIIADKVAEAMFALGSQSQVDNEKKYKAYKVCQKINGNPSGVEISTEEATLIKEVCGDYLVSGAYGQVCDLIEGEN